MSEAKPNGWENHLIELLGWDEKEGAKWNAPYNFDVKGRDIMSELEERLAEGKWATEEIKKLKEEGKKLALENVSREWGEEDAKEEIQKLKEENEKMNTLLCVGEMTIDKITKRNEDAMKLSMEQNEKFMNQLEELKDDFEKSITEIIGQISSLADVNGLTDRREIQSFTYDKNLRSIISKQLIPFPMEDVKECITQHLQSILDELAEFRRQIDDEELMDREDWEESCDFDLDEAGELLNDYENGELVYHRDLDEVKSANEKFLKGMAEIEEIANVYGGESDDSPFMRQRTAEGIDVRDVAPYIKKLIAQIKKLKGEPKAGCDLPYPPPMMVEGKWEEGYDDLEREAEVVREYIKEYGNPSLESIKHFVDTYEGSNDMVPIVKKWLYKDNTIVYDGLIGLLEHACDEKKTKRVGEQIAEEAYGLHMEAMRCSHYLLSWYMKSSNNRSIGSYPRLVEFYWNYIGDWRA